MEVASKLFLARKHASLSDAKLAYFEGDFERCLEICANIRVSTVRTASELTLITARAYLRSGRPREAQNTLAGARETHTTLDACLTSQMLEATALIRQNDPDAGITLLIDAAGVSADAHFAIRSEIAFCTALGYWAKREIDVAESYLRLVDPRSDIIHARALELQAWCHTSRRDFARGADYFRLTLSRLDDCQASDRAITATAVSTLAIFAAELFDRDLARLVQTRMHTMGWSSGLSAYRYLTLEHQALFSEFEGNTIEAYRFALHACENAATLADQVFGWTLKSAIARNAGEAYSPIIFAQRAQELLASMDLRKLDGEERFALLRVAESCAHFDPEKAAQLCAMYSSLSPIDPMISGASDPRQTAYEDFVQGVVAQARGEGERAQSSYRKSFRTFRDLRYVRRAVISANALVQLTADNDARRYISAHLAGTSNYISKGNYPTDNDDAPALERHSLFASLSPAQREVVILICAGKSNKEIAHLRNVGEQTIKNMLTKSVFPVFGVSNRAALVSACLREGAVTTGGDLRCAST